MQPHNYAAITAIAAVIAVIITIIVQVIESRRSRLSRSADLILRLTHQFNGAELVRVRRLAAEALLAGRNDVAIDEVLNFFSTVATLYKRKAVDRELLWGEFFDWFNYYWTATRSYVDENRKDDPTIWKGLVEMYSSMSEIDAKKRKCGASDVAPTVAQIKEFLSDEVALSQRLENISR